MIVVARKRKDFNMKLEDYIYVVPNGKNRDRMELEGKSLDYLRLKSNLPLPSTKLNGIDDRDEGYQWLLRGDRDCDLLGVRVTRTKCAYDDWRKHNFTLYVLYKKGTWERLEVRTVYAKGNMSGPTGLNSFDDMESVLDEFSDIIMHLLDVYQVAVIK